MIDQRSRVLLIDDFGVVRMALRRCLNDLGLTDIEEAEDGLQGLHKLKEAEMEGRRFHLVFSDWSMPNMTGLELISECRKLEYLKDIPIVLVTAEGEKTQVLRAFSQGVADYVVKPFTLDVIKSKIEQLNQRLRRKQASKP
jgi:two-component system chemotaxis response regulator CheY